MIPLMRGFFTFSFSTFLIITINVLVFVSTPVSAQNRNNGVEISISSNDIPDVPGNLADNQKESLSNQRASLIVQLNALQEEAQQYNAKCTGELNSDTDKELISECSQMKVQWDRDYSNFISNLNSYKKAISQ